MNADKLKKDLVVLRNYHQAGVEMAEKILAELEIVSPKNPTKRKQKQKENRITFYQNYLASGKWKKSKKQTKTTK